jgi:hypothetical protein
MTAAKGEQDARAKLGSSGNSHVCLESIKKNHMSDLPDSLETEVRKTSAAT